MLWIIPGVLTSYIIGSIPTAYIFGRFLKGIDIRKFGSGNVGATNALRVLGPAAGIAVLLLDALKGFLSVILVANFVHAQAGFVPEETLRIILGLACICGHNWTIFLRFKGGKGIAVTFGVLLGLSVKFAGLKLIFILVILTWLLIFVLLRIVSVASVASGIAFPVYMLIFKESAVLVFSSILISIFIVLRHKPNLKRFLQGKEPRLAFKKPG